MKIAATITGLAAFASAQRLARLEEAIRQRVRDEISVADKNGALRPEGLTHPTSETSATRRVR